MKRKLLAFSVLVLSIGVISAIWLYKSSGLKRSHPPLHAKTETGLAQHSLQFEKGVRKVIDCVYVAVGYGLANSVMIEGDDGLIVIDTMTTREEAEAVLAEFGKISNKPIKAVIYTHNHADHIFGAEVFIRGGGVEIYAHETTDAIVQRLLTELRPIIGTRSLRMFGSVLDPADLINAGLGPRLGITPESTTGYVRPTRTFADTLDVEEAGVKFRLIHAPGETDDQIVVWLPDKKLLVCGDNFYWAFPNLYTIRGTVFRSLKAWRQSLDMMRDLEPEYLVPCHTGPIAGAGQIAKILTDYRDAIQFVHDQSLRGINLGLTPDELVEFVRLPPHLADAPYLQPFYGKVEWSARSMFDGNMGWFDGDAAHLHPLSRPAEASLMARLAGGEDKLLDHASALLTENEFQAALELTGHLLQLNPENTEAGNIRILALTNLAEREQNPNARNYYLSEALEIRDDFVIRETTKPSAEMLHFFPLSGYLDSLAINLDPKASADVNQRVGLIFPDVGEGFTIHVRWGVAEIRAENPETVEASNPDILVKMDSKVFKEMLGGLRNLVLTLPKFDYPKGGAAAFGSFLKLFKPGEMKRPFDPYRPEQDG